MEVIIQNLLKEALKNIQDYSKDLNLNGLTFYVVVQDNPHFGDFSTNIAFQLASLVKDKPINIALKIVKSINSELVDKVEVKGGGFINFFMKPSFFQKFLYDFLNASNVLLNKKNNDKKILIEFVSANPTGPLHIGHGRGVSYGDSTARILRAAGFSVTKEYYINDRGNQIINLGKSIYYWYKLHFGETFPFPEDGYKGEYIKDIAESLVADCGAELLNCDEDKAILKCAEYGKKKIMEDINNDLHNLDVYFDNYFSESSLFENNYVDETLKLLETKGLAYKKDGALWLKTTSFGDDKDRVLIKSTGEYTYFASDIAYHRNKYERGFDLLIDVWGADHHGYVNRMKAAIEALGYDSSKLRIVLIQMVNLIKNGEKVSMSTRANEFIPLNWLYKEVGKDALRFFYCLRSPDGHFDFDINLAKERNSDNPVFYIQYAHARIMSLFRNAAEKNVIYQKLNNLELITLKEEINLIKKIYSFGSVVENASQMLEPNRVAAFLIELATNFHYYYNNTKIVDEKSVPLSNARLCLCDAVARVIRCGLDLLGVNSPDRM
jgi:arginyl-tRNA synthetase